MENDRVCQSNNLKLLHSQIRRELSCRLSLQNELAAAAIISERFV